MGKMPQKTGNDIDFSDLSRYHKRRLEGRGAWQVLPPIKQQLTVRIDADVVEWLRSQGCGIQSRIQGSQGQVL